MKLKHSGKATIKDIAEICDVSVQTVSRVINNKPDVSKQTREKVEKVIAELAFTPNAVARSLVSRHSRTIGVILGGLSYISSAYTLNGINEICEKADYNILIKELIDINTTDITPIIQRMAESQVEGIIYAAPNINGNMQTVQKHLPSNCPPIIFCKSEPFPGLATINVDNYGGAKRATQHLISLGCQHIGHISGPLFWREGPQRKQGWEDALKEAGLKFDKNSWVEGDWSGSSGNWLLPKLLRQYPEMDGIFVGNDEMSMGAIRYAIANGIRIPKDIALAGFDNQNESPYFTPSITSVSAPFKEMGRLAVKTLFAMMNGEYASPSDYPAIMLDVELIIRESSAGKK